MMHAFQWSFNKPQCNVMLHTFVPSFTDLTRAKAAKAAHSNDGSTLFCVLLGFLLRRSMLRVTTKHGDAATF